MEGEQEGLKMNNHAISGLGNPTELKDAVHKFYVDTLIEHLQQQLDTITERNRHQLELLETRVVRLERLALRAAEDVGEETAEP